MEWKTYIGPYRNEVKDSVFSMYETTYSELGTHIKSSDSLLKYPVWEICFLGNKPIAFKLLDKTPHGFKSALGGHDGSLEGKSAAVKSYKELFSDRPGFWYGELSHAPKDIAKKRKVPVVPSEKAIEVLKNLGHDAEKISDEEYRRILRNIGPVEKTMFGHPTKSPMSPDAYAMSKRSLRIGYKASTH